MKRKQKQQLNSSWRNPQQTYLRYSSNKSSSNFPPHRWKFFRRNLICLSAARTSELTYRKELYWKSECHLPAPMAVKRWYSHWSTVYGGIQRWILIHSLGITHKTMWMIPASFRQRWGVGHRGLCHSSTPPLFRVNWHWLKWSPYFPALSPKSKLQYTTPFLCFIQFL